MNAHRKFSFASLLTTTAFSLLLSVVAISNANADPCFDDPKRAYKYLIAKEKAVIQAREQKVININRANEGELVSLDGIGSSKAQAIILYRDMFGDFKTVDELAKVKGIGAKTVEKNQRRLSVRD
ncbi:ComEA family DNA-binding protein [Psychrobacter sp. NPDC078631]|uniref:ComEA family DNA-binding protein n=1 Tax=Psychrobacter sp. NPDC078631 TaxID=3390666 RepID=UPI003D0775E7